MIPTRAGLLALTCLLVGTGVSGQTAASTYIANAAVAYTGTPGGRGLLPTALSEAAIALEHAELALEDSVSVAGIRRHAAHVLHALDPSVGSGAGPGLGFGVRRAAAEAAVQVDLALDADSISENMAIHGLRIAIALDNAVQWSNEAIQLVQRIQSTSSVFGAQPLVRRLLALCHAIRYGRDADGNGIVGWQEGEGGLAQATYHMNLLRRAEGLAP